MSTADWRDLLKVVDQGVAYRTDRKFYPARVTYTPRDDEDLLNPARITFAELDALIHAGFVRESTYNGYTNAVLTYAGRKNLLVSRGFDFARWRSIYGDRICCSEAIPTPCVCIVRVLCPIHRGRCHGSHD